MLVPDLGQLGISMYNYGSFARDEEALKVIYGVDLHDASHRRQLADRGVLTTLLDRYASLTDRRIWEIKHVYPRLGYVVEHRERTPLDVHFPVVYENSAYAIYTIAGAPLAPQVAAPQAQPVFSLDVAQPSISWSAGTRETVIERVGDRLRLVSDRSKYHYQVITPDVHVEAGRRYVVSYHIEVTAGGMSLGVLDPASDTWIASRPLGPTATAGKPLMFTAHSDKVQIILSNNNEEAIRSVAEIYRLTVEPVVSMRLPDR